MRCLSVALVLAACVPEPGTQTTDADLDTVSTTMVDTTDPGIQTVTGNPTNPMPTTTEASETTGATTSDDTGTTEEMPDTSTGPVQECGNGIVEGDEACDDGNDIDNDECSNDCKIPGCGDGVVQEPEECDDGNDIDTDECTNGCKLAFCGDGKIWDGEEECDDGNQDNTDACLNTCKVASCGDGHLWAGNEVCDDGFNDGSYNGCMPDCNSLGPHCGDGKHDSEWEYCDTTTPYAGLACADTCMYDFSTVGQMSCHASCSWGGPSGCDISDATAFCRLRTGNKNATATSFMVADPVDVGSAFACSDPNTFLGDPDPRVNLGILANYGVNKAVMWIPSNLKKSHGNAKVIPASSLVCTP